MVVPDEFLFIFVFFIYLESESASVLSPPAKKHKVNDFVGWSHIALDRTLLDNVIRWDTDVCSVAPQEFQDSNELALTLGHTKDPKLIRVSFQPPKSTLLADPGIPYLPEIGAVISTEGSSVCGNIFPRNLNNKLELFKQNCARSVHIENEFLHHKNFKFTFLNQDTDGEILECILISAPAPPLIITIPPGYPEQVPEYQFPKEFEYLSFFQFTKEDFEKKILTFNGSFTLSMLLTAFESSVYETVK